MDFMLGLYKDKRTVFTLADMAMLIPESNSRWLAHKAGYYARKGKLLNPRRGIYAKPGYDPRELACILYTPSYLSLEYILQKAGVIFQYDSRFTCISYLSREIAVDGRTYSYRQMKQEIIINTTGVLTNRNNINMATPERAFLDLLYLNKDFYVDNTGPLDRRLIASILPVYGSAALGKRVNKLMTND